MADVTCNHGVLFVVGVCLLVLIHINGTAAITCLRCDNVEDVKACTEFMQCGEDEVCYMESQLSMRTYKPVYTSGCRPIRECNLLNCSANIFGSMNVTKTRRQTPGLTICSECCYNDTCNMDLCGVHYIEKNAANVHCFKCNDMGDNETCSHNIQCQSNQMCISQIITRRHDGGGYRYNLDCFDKRMCLMLQTLHNDVDSLCCDDDLCNTNPKSSKHVSPAVVNTMQCPTDLVKPTTTKATTTVAPVTSTPALKPATVIVTAATLHTHASTALKPTTTTISTTTRTSTSPTTDPAPCVDELSNCPVYGQQLDICKGQTFSAYKLRCKAFCKLC